MSEAPHFLPQGMPLGAVSERVLDLPTDFNRYRRAWWMLFTTSCLLLGVFVVAAAVALWRGVGVWGNNIPVNWGFAILNYMWWLGIGHAGTFISALLLLLNRPWRNSLNRLAELMTLMAVVCAGVASDRVSRAASGGAFSSSGSISWPKSSNSMTRT